MSDIKIMVDSSADIPQEIIEKYNIGVIPLMSVFGEKSYVIGKELSTEKFYEKLSSGDVIPTTSLTPYATLYEMLLEESKKHETVIYFSISSKASGQNHSANLVREDILENGNPNADIRIIDTMSFSMLIGTAAINAAIEAGEGKSPDEIIEKAKSSIANWHVLFVVDDLMYLERGGRLRKSAAILGSLLDIKPVLTVNDGLIEVETKLRGKKKICKKLCDLMDENDDRDENSSEILILHTDEEKAAEMTDELEDRYNLNAKSYLIGPLIGTHTGTGIVAVAYRTK